MYEENLRELKEFLSFDKEEKKIRHNKDEKANFFPFVTRNPERVTFKNGFRGITGEFCRLITNKKLVDEYSIVETIDDIVENGNIEFQNGENDKEKFKNILKEFVYPNEKLVILTPQLFSYLPLANSKESIGEKKIAQFIKDVLWQKNEKIKNYIKNAPADTVLTRFFINNFNQLEKQVSNDPIYNKKLNYISDLFMEDFEFLIEDEDYFINHFHFLLAYYYFFYITQLFLNFQKQDNKHKYELYYILNWESASKKRKSYEIGYYKEIKKWSTKLLPQVYATEHLNFLFGVEGETLNELETKFKALNQVDQNQLKNIIKRWISDYRNNRDLKEMNLKNNYNDLVLSLINSIGEAVGDATKSRYRLSIDEIGKKYFLKSRGSLSYVGNITKDFFLFLTAISVKDNRIKVKELFSRLEKRGIYLDRYSKKEALDFLNKLNVLDKKSDSGDAQYVKTIL